LFTDSQNKTESYGNYLNAAGWKNEVINGAQEQSHRLDVLEKLIKFKCRILITTDLMARGIDIENINLIINLDLPHDCFTYLHRIGRAGRFGSYGIAITFLHGEEELGKFEKMLGDIGGSEVNVVRYPEESVAYDFWDFKHENGLENILERSVAETDDEKSVMNDTMLNNLALLNITRKLIDDQSTKEKENSFNLDALLEDYEQSLTEGGGEIVEKTGVKKIVKVEAPRVKETVEIEPENAKETVKESSKPPAAKQPEEVRRVIFKRTPADDQETASEISSSESESEASESETDEEDPEQDFDSEAEPEDIPQSHPLQSPPKPLPEPSLNPYTSFVSSDYSQWRNIYHFQLANIQSFIEMSRK
jgi:superfamily II DNA/RNA helicase